MIHPFLQHQGRMERASQHNAMGYLSGRLSEAERPHSITEDGGAGYAERGNAANFQLPQVPAEKLARLEQVFAGTSETRMVRRQPEKCIWVKAYLPDGVRTMMARDLAELLGTTNGTIHAASRRGSFKGIRLVRVKRGGK